MEDEKVNEFGGIPKEKLDEYLMLKSFQRVQEYGDLNTDNLDIQEVGSVVDEVNKLAQYFNTEALDKLAEKLDDTKTKMSSEELNEGALEEHAKTFNEIFSVLKELVHKKVETKFRPIDSDSTSVADDKIKEFENENSGVENLNAIARSYEDQLISNEHDESDVVDHAVVDPDKRGEDLLKAHYSRNRRKPMQEWAKKGDNVYLSDNQKKEINKLGIK